MMRNIISICLLLWGFTYSNASDLDSISLTHDTSYVDVRQFDPEKIQEHKADEDFDYGKRVEAEMSLWQRFKIWLSKILQKLFQFGTDTPIGKIILYTILICGIIYAIYKLSTIQSRRLFYRENRGTLDYEVHHEDIHKMDFDKLIDEAINNKNYRLAIRLIYLYALKHLSDKQMIDWQPGKTNFDYVNELQNNSLKPGFNDLSYYFDYAWYGDFKVNESLFNKVNVTFTDWKKKIS